MNIIFNSSLDDLLRPGCNYILKMKFVESIKYGVDSIKCRCHVVIIATTYAFSRIFVF